MKINLNPEMNSNIADIMRCSKQPAQMYGAALIDAYRASGLEPDEIPHWIPVSESLPEYVKRLSRYSDSEMELISVLACGYLKGNEKLSVREVNRLLIKKTGIKQLDEQYTGKWEWSKHFEKVVFWMPLPQPPKEEKRC